MLFSKHRNNKTILIFDVQSAIVRASVVNYSGSEKPRVLFTAERMLIYRKETGTAHLIKDTLDALQGCVDSAMKFVHDEAAKPKKETGSAIDSKISEIHFVLSSPWIVSKAKTITQVYKRPVTVTKNGIVSIIERERVGDAPDQTGPVEIIEEKIFSVRLNGYHIIDWEGKTAQNIGISFAVSVAGTGMIQRFRDICRHIVPERKISFHSSLLLQHVGIKILKPEKRDYALIHIHGELTDLVISEDNDCVFFGSFPMGIATVTRLIGRETKSSDNAADSLIALYSGDYLDKSNGAVTTTAVEHAIDVWNEGLSKLLKESGHSLRTTIITAKTHEEFFKQSFKRTHSGSKIESFTVEEISDHVSFGPRSEMLRLTGLYAISINSLTA